MPGELAILSLFGAEFGSFRLKAAEAATRQLVLFLDQITVGQAGLRRGVAWRSVACAGGGEGEGVYRRVAAWGRGVIQSYWTSTSSENFTIQRAALTFSYEAPYLQNFADCARPDGLAEKLQSAKAGTEPGGVGRGEDRSWRVAAKVNLLPRLSGPKN